MRGNQPEVEPFESPFARTILPQKGRKVRREEPQTNPDDVPGGPSTSRAPGAPQAGFAPAETQVPAFAAAAPQGPPAPVQGFQPATPPQGFRPPAVPGFGPPAFPPAASPAFGLPPSQGFPSQAAAPAPASAPAPATQGQAASDFPAFPSFPTQPSDQYEPHHLLAGGSPAVPDDDAGGSPDTSDRPRSSKRRLAFLAIPLVIVLGAAAYLYVPKLLNSSDSSKAPTITLPARLGSAVKAVDADSLKTVRAAQTHARAVLPALANVNLAFYGKGPELLVGAGLLPSSIEAKTTAEQDSLVRQINNKLSTDSGSPDKLAHVAFPARQGQLWCGFVKADGAVPATTDCIYVDRYAVVFTSVVGSDNTKNITKAKQIVQLVERQ